MKLNKMTKEVIGFGGARVKTSAAVAAAAMLMV
jgi:hypothetical protein